MVSAPTIDDARTAGRALTGAGAREVLAFGSVARGDADPHSDIDLVVILDDLEYRHRRDAAEALEKLAAGATGQCVDVWLTDAPEWAAQNRRAASFAAAIKGDLVVVAARNGDDSAIRWDKEQVMATSDTEDAWRRLDEVRTHLQRLIRRHHPDHIERSASAAGEDDSRYDHQSDRLVEACTAAAMAIETAFKALGTDAQIDAKLLHYNHRVGPIVEQLPAEDQTAAPADPQQPDHRALRQPMAHPGRLPARPRTAPPLRGGHPRVYHRHRRRRGSLSRLRRRQDGSSPRRRRSVNNTIDRLTAELRQLAASIDISTGERLSPDPGDDLARGL